LTLAKGGSKEKSAGQKELRGKEFSRVLGFPKIKNFSVLAAQKVAPFSPIERPKTITAR
jgi:hypothetical protein